VESYSNEDGFSALKQRLESAQKSWASVHEIVRLTRLIWKLNNDDFNPDYVQSAYNQSASSLEKDKIRNDLLSNLHQIAGDLRALYSVAQLDSISEKRMRALPAKCKVYDIIRLSMELASKKLKTESGRKIHLYVGELVSAEYDLEESGTKFGSFDDFIDTKAKDRFKKSGEAALE
jgi:hypothetical protein